MTRDFRDIAVRLVDQLRGYTWEHASNPEGHRNDYEWMEGQLRDEFERSPRTEGYAHKCCGGRVAGIHLSGCQEERR